MDGETLNVQPQVDNAYVQQQATINVQPEPLLQQPTDLGQEQAAEVAISNIIHDQQVQAYSNKGHAISDWIDHDYDYDPNDIGNLWVAGAINDANTQMSFLEATLNEDMYSEQDIGKYFFDQNLAIARAYAKEKKHEVMYGYYRAAQEKALAEGAMLGWYMPPEAHYMLGQWTTAKRNLEEGGLDEAARLRAENIIKSAEAFFGHNGITDRGVKTLSQLYYEETVRSNKAQEALQQAANDINSAYNSTNKEQAYFNMRAQELVSGTDLDGDGYIGHVPGSEDWGVFEGFSDFKDWAMANPDTALTVYDPTTLKAYLGEDAYEQWENEWRISQGNYNKMKGAADKDGKIDESALIDTGMVMTNNDPRFKESEDGKIYAFMCTDANGNKEYRLYYKTTGGLYKQITTTGDLKLKDETNLSFYQEFFTDQALIYNGKELHFGQKQDTSKKEGSYTKYSTTSRPTIYTKQDEEARRQEEVYGRTWEKGYIDIDGENSGVVFSETDKNGKKTYYVVHKDGTVKQVKDLNKLLYAKVDKDGNITWHNANGTRLSDWQQTKMAQDGYNRELLYSQGHVKYDTKTRNYVIVYTDSNGNTAYGAYDKLFKSTSYGYNYEF